MKIACPHCHAGFALDDKRVPPAGLSIKCPKCKQPFAVHRPKPEDEGKIVEGKPLAVPLPGGPGASSPGARTSSPGAPVSREGEPRPGPVPLPGSSSSRPPPPLVSAAPKPEPVRASGAVPLPGSASRPPPARPAAPSDDPFAGIELDVPAAPDAAQASSPEAAPAAVSSPGIDFATGDFQLPADFVPAPDPFFTDAPATAEPAAQSEEPSAQTDANAPPDWVSPQSSDEFTVRAVDAASDPFAITGGELGAVRAEPKHDAAAITADFPAPLAAAEPAFAEGDDPFGLDLPVSTAPAPAAAVSPPAGDAFRLELDVDAQGAPAPAAPALAAPERPKEPQRAPARSVRAPPVMSASAASAAAPPRLERAAPSSLASTLEEPLFDDLPAPRPKPKPVEEPAPREPISARVQRAFKPVGESLGSLRRSPARLGGAISLVVLLAVVALGVHARSTSAGLFWKNLWTSSGKQHSAAAREALAKGDQQLADGSFGVAREALGTAARTLQALPDDDEARAFFVLCASELKIGWGATGGDWDQAGHAVDKLNLKLPASQRALGAHALAAGDFSQAKAILAPLGDAPNADTESVWLYAQALLRSNEAGHASQVLDNALKGKSPAPVKLLLLRGLVERARGKPEAGKFFEQALALSPAFGRALIEEAEVKLKAGDIAAASALLDRALTPETRHQLDATEEGRASMLRARLFAEQHQSKEAEAQFDRAATLDANSAEVHAAYAIFRLRRREYDKAARQFDAALAADATNPEVLGMAARAYLGASRYLDADKRIREALAKEPDNARLIFVSGKVAESIGKLEEAGKEYDRALSKKADLAEALIAVGQIALTAGDKEKATDRAVKAETAPAAEKSALDLEGLADLWLALGQPDKAKADALAAQALDPEDPYADFVAGRALSALGELPAARALFEKALARVDTDPAMHYELGSLLRRQGDLPGARKELEKALAIDAKESRFQSRLGALMVEQGDAEGAEAHLRQALLLNDRNDEALYFLGRSLILEKKLSEAIDVLKRAIEADSKAGQYDYQLGLAYEGGSQLADATAAFTQSTSKDPKSADAWEHLGLVLAAQNLFSDALDALEKAAALEPERARLWAEIGDAQQQSGDADKAIASLQKSVKLDSAQAGVWTKLGIAFRDKGCDSCKVRAIEALQRATVLAPQDPTAFHELGYVYKDDRKRAEAIAAFKRYLELKPDASDADSVKDDIFYLQEEGKRAP